MYYFPSRCALLNHPGNLNPTIYQRATHVDIHYHCIRQLIQHNQISIGYSQSLDNPVDVLTKISWTQRTLPLPRTLCRAKLFFPSRFRLNIHLVAVDFRRGGRLQRLRGLLSTIDFHFAFVTFNHYKSSQHCLPNPNQNFTLVPRAISTVRRVKLVRVQ